MDESRNRDVEVPLWLLIALIGGAGFLLGLILTRRNGTSGALSGSMQLPPSQVPIQIFNYGATGDTRYREQSQLAVPTIPVTQGPGEDFPSKRTKFDSMTLSATEGTRIFTATGKWPWQVRIRAIGPSAAFAIISTEGSALQNTGLNVGDAMILPVGQETGSFFLHPGQSVFGRGSTNNVQISYVASVEVAR